MIQNFATLKTSNNPTLTALQLPYDMMSAPTQPLTLRDCEWRILKRQLKKELRMSRCSLGLWLTVLTYSGIVAPSFSAPPSLEGVSWAVNLDGQNYYGIDVFAKCSSETNRLLNVFNTSVQLNSSTGAVFHHVPTSVGQITARPWFFTDPVASQVDTFVAVGGEQPEAAPFFAFDPGCPTDIFVTNPSILTTGGWFNSPPTDGIQTAGSDLRVRIGRFVLKNGNFVGGATLSCSWKIGWVEEFGSPAQFITLDGSYFFTDELSDPPIDERGLDYWYASEGGCPPLQGPTLPPPPAPFGSLINKQLIWTTPGGWVVGWQLNGLSIIGVEALTAIQPNQTVVAGAADLDGDGDRDLLWRNPTTQNIIGCTVQNGVIFQSASIAAPASPVLNWQYLGAIDMNGDGREDLVWRNVSGGTSPVRVWQMNGLVREANVQIGISPGFEFLALADLNQDGKGDIVWRLANGVIQVWLGNGLAAPTTKVLTGCGPVPLFWKLVAVPDLDGDGDTDFLWHNTQNGNVNGWLIQGTAKVAGGLVGPSVSVAWQVADVQDLDGDGDDDVVWRNTLFNDVKAWQMQGLVKQAGGTVSSVADGWASLK